MSSVLEFFFNYPNAHPDGRQSLDRGVSPGGVSESEQNVLNKAVMVGLVLSSISDRYIQLALNTPSLRLRQSQLN